MADASNIMIQVQAKDEATPQLNAMASQINGIASKIQGSWEGAFTGMGSAVSGFAVGLASFEGVKKFIDTGQKFEDMSFKMKETFGKNADEMAAKAQQLSDKGKQAFSSLDIEKAMLKSSNVMKRYGVEGKEYFDLMARSEDFAITKSMDLIELMKLETKAFQGKAKAAEQLGVVLNDNYMKGIAGGGKYNDTWGNMSDQQKFQAREQEFMAQTKKMADATNRSMDTLTGAWRSLSNEMLNGQSWTESISHAMADLVNKAHEAYSAMKKLTKPPSESETPSLDAKTPFEKMTDWFSQKWKDIGTVRSQMLRDEQEGLSQALDYSFQPEVSPKVAKFDTEGSVREAMQIGQKFEEMLKKRADLLGRAAEFEKDWTSKHTQELSFRTDSETRINDILKEREGLQSLIEQLQGETDEEGHLLPDAAAEIGKAQYAFDALGNTMLSEQEKVRKFNDEVNRLDDIKIKKLTEDINAMLDSGAKDLFSNAGFQGKISQMMKIQTDLEESMRAADAKKAKAEAGMSSGLLTGEEWQAALNAIYQAQPQMDTYMAQLKSVQDEMSKVEAKRRGDLAKEGQDAMSKLQELQKTAQEVMSQDIKLGIDTSQIQAALNLMDDLIAKGTVASYQLSDFNPKSKLDLWNNPNNPAMSVQPKSEYLAMFESVRPITSEDLFPVAQYVETVNKFDTLSAKMFPKFDIDVSSAWSNLDSIAGKLDAMANKMLTFNQLLAQMPTGNDFTVDFYGWNASKLPLTEKINQMIQLFDDMPEGGKFTTKFLTDEGLPLSEAMKLYADYEKANLIHDKSVSAAAMADKYRDSGSYSMAFYYDNLARSLADQFKDALSAWKIEAATSLEAGTSGTSGSGSGGITVDVGPVVLQYTGSGNVKDDMITLADRFDEAIASKIRSNSSKIPDALQSRMR